MTPIQFETVRLPLHPNHTPGRSAPFALGIAAILTSATLAAWQPIGAQSPEQNGASQPKKQKGIGGILRQVLDAASTPADSRAGALPVDEQWGVPAPGVPDGFMFDPAVVRMIRWDDPGLLFESHLDQDFAFRCAPGGEVGRVIGTRTYSGWSTICSAAVHAGIISPRTGGIVVIRIGPEQPSYTASTRNGVTSEGGSPHNGSFVFLKPPESMLKPKEGALPPIDVDSTKIQTIKWDATALDLRSHLGQTFAYRCPSGGSVEGVYGTATYLAWSSICTAAVHAGRIGARDGGIVAIEMRGQQLSYAGSRRNGITSEDRRDGQAEGGGFAFRDIRFVTEPTPSPAAPQTAGKANTASRLEDIIVWSAPSGPSQERTYTLQLPAALQAAIKQTVPTWRPLRVAEAAYGALYNAEHPTRTYTAIVADLDGDRRTEAVLLGVLSDREGKPLQGDLGLVTASRVFVLLGVRQGARGFEVTELSRKQGDLVSQQGPEVPLTTSVLLSFAQLSPTGKVSTAGRTPWVRWQDGDCKEEGWQWTLRAGAWVKSKSPCGWGN